MHDTVDQGPLMFGILWSKGDRPDAQPAWRIAFLVDMEPAQWLKGGDYTSTQAFNRLQRLIEKRHFGY